MDRGSKRRGVADTVDPLWKRVQANRKNGLAGGRGVVRPLRPGRPRDPALRPLRRGDVARPLLLPLDHLAARPLHGDGEGHAVRAADAGVGDPRRGGPGVQAEHVHVRRRVRGAAAAAAEARAAQLWRARHRADHVGGGAAARARAVRRGAVALLRLGRALAAADQRAARRRGGDGRAGAGPRLAHARGARQRHVPLAAAQPPRRRRQPELERHVGAGRRPRRLGHVPRHRALLGARDTRARPRRRGLEAGPLRRRPLGRPVRRRRRAAQFGAQFCAQFCAKFARNF